MTIFRNILLCATYVNKIFKNLRLELIIIPTVPVKIEFQNNDLYVLWEKLYMLVHTISTSNSMTDSNKTHRAELQFHTVNKNRRHSFM